MRARIGIIILCALLAISCSNASHAQATTPAAIVSKIKPGMTMEQVMDIVDMEHFTQNRAHVAVNCSEITVTDTGLQYNATKDIESPYFLWLFFGTVVKDLAPAVVAFSAETETVLFVGRMPFEQAQELVEWQSGRPFRR